MRRQSNNFHVSNSWQTFTHTYLICDCVCHSSSVKKCNALFGHVKHEKSDESQIAIRMFQGDSDVRMAAFSILWFLWWSTVPQKSSRTCARPFLIIIGHVLFSFPSNPSSSPRQKANMSGSEFSALLNSMQNSSHKR